MTYGDELSLQDSSRYYAQQRHIPFVVVVTTPRGGGASSAAPFLSSSPSASAAPLSASPAGSAPAPDLPASPSSGSGDILAESPLGALVASAARTPTTHKYTLLHIDSADGSARELIFSVRRSLLKQLWELVTPRRPPPKLTGPGGISWRAGRG